MTEQEWLNLADPKRMLAFRQGRARWRKRLLYGCACCRLVWPLLLSEEPRQAVEVCEGHADGLSNEDELEACRNAARATNLLVSEVISALAQSLGRAVAQADATAGAALMQFRLANMTGCAAGAAEALIGERVERAVALTSHAWRLRAWQSPAQRQSATWWIRSARANLLRCIFGNPFRPVKVGRACRVPIVIDLAQASYEERLLPSGELDPTRLAILADALEEAGSGAELLEHLRAPGPHVRGCHVVDALTGWAN